MRLFECFWNIISVWSFFHLSFEEVSLIRLFVIYIYIFGIVSYRYYQIYIYITNIFIYIGNIGVPFSTTQIFRKLSLVDENVLDKIYKILRGKGEVEEDGDFEF